MLHVRKQFLFIVLISTLFLNYQPTAALDKLVKFACLGAFIQLAMTKKPVEKPLTFEEFITETKTLFPNLNIKKLLPLLYRLWSECIIGFAGDSGSIKVSGSKIIIPRDYPATTKTLSDGETIQLIYHKGSDAYGLCGTLWSLINSLGGNAKTFNETVGNLETLSEFLDRDDVFVKPPKKN